MSSPHSSRAPAVAGTDSTRQTKGGCVSITLAFILLSLIVTFMLALPMGKIGVAILIFVGFVAVIATLHYFIWGRLLTRLIEREQQATTQEAGDPD